MPVADDELNKQSVELMTCLKPTWSGSVYTRCLALLRTLLVLQCDVRLQLKQHNCRQLETATDLHERYHRFADDRERLIATNVQQRAQCFEQLARSVEVRKLLEAAFERFTEMRESIDDKDSDAELSETEQRFRSEFDDLDKMSSRLKEIVSTLDRVKPKSFSELFQTEIDFVSLAGTDRETLQLDQKNLQFQIDSLRESVSKALQLFLQAPDASLEDLCDLPLPSIAVPEEAPEVDLSACIATQFNKVFGKEQFGFELHVAQEYVQLSHAIVNDLIYVLECRKPVDVTVSVFDTERLRRTVRSVQRLLGTTIDRSDANEFGHLMQEVISDIVRLFRYDLEQSAKAAEFANSLSIDLDIIDRKISRFGQKGTGLNAVRLTQTTWDLLIELVAAGRHGTTGKQLVERLDANEGELSKRKTELKNAISPLDLTIPHDEFRLVMVSAHGNRLAWTDISIDEASRQMTRAGKKYQSLPAEFSHARTSEQWMFAKRLMEAGGECVDFSKIFPNQTRENLRQIKLNVMSELRKLDITVQNVGPSTWKAVDVNPKRER